MFTYELMVLVNRKVENATISEVLKAYPRAMDKLANLIARFGDAEGQRYTTTYISHLVAEEIKSNRATQFCDALYEIKRNEPTQRAELASVTTIIVAQKN